ncbi:MAG: glutamate-cysteine ligase family protein, partial [Planctomycetaceae bacterium]
NWSEYVWVINHLITTGFINSIREIWWDIRPHHNFGTVEVRICDMPPNLRQVLGITALVQCLVTAISEDVDEGTYQLDYHPMMVQQNKWRATRFGAAAQLVNNDDNEQYSVEASIRQLVEKLRPSAEKLNCSAELESALSISKETGAEQQLAIYEQTGDRAEVVRQMIERNHWSQFV